MKMWNLPVPVPHHIQVCRDDPFYILFIKDQTVMISVYNLAYFNGLLIPIWMYIYPVSWLIILTVNVPGAKRLPIIPYVMIVKILKRAFHPEKYFFSPLKVYI